MPYIKNALASMTISQKLLLLFLVIFLPALGIIISSGLAHRSATILNAEKDAGVVALSLAAQQEKIAIGTRQMLSTLAQLPEVQGLDAEACNRLLRDIQGKNPLFSVLLAVKPNGDLFAASSAFVPGTNLSDRKHVKDAIRTLDFSVGEYIVGRVTPVAVLSYSYPVLDREKNLVAIVIASFRLDGYSDFLAKANLPMDSAVVFCDHAGKRLFRIPEDAIAPGTPIPADVFEHIKGHDSEQGYYEKLAQDGIPRFYAFQRLRLSESSSPYMTILVGFSKDPIFKTANRAMLGDLSRLGMAALSALCLAWFLGRYAFIKPINRLVQSTQRFARGEPDARTGLPHSPDELGQLAKSFDEMVIELKQSANERQGLEAKLRQAQKLEAIGTLAGGIAHDFNNILAPIIGYTEMALSDTPRSNPMRDGLEQTLSAAMRARDLVKQILAFARSSNEQEKIPVSIGSVVKEALKLLRASLPSSIEMEHRIEDGVAIADATQIHQVLMNLCTNAAHAMNGVGTMAVNLSEIHPGENDLAELSGLELLPGPHLKLSVSDTGCGMDSQALERIFDPYFTTKEVGKGSGLGLAVVHGIVKRHHGAIGVRSVPGKGTTFDVYIPAAGDFIIAKAEADPTLPEGTERVLFVDDEPAVVKMGTEILVRLGYAVTPETDSVNAAEVFRARPDEFDLVITDYTMAKLTGTELAEKLRQIRPDIPVILTTGFSEKITKATAAESGLEFIMKPFGMRRLAELVRQVLDKSHPEGRAGG